jgi:hypothetical protein
MRVAIFEVVFLLVILKIPIVYLCAVVWWAIRAEPRPLEGATLPAEPLTPPSRHWPTRPRPRGGPARTYARRESRAGTRVDA